MNGESWFGVWRWGIRRRVCIGAEAVQCIGMGGISLVSLSPAVSILHPDGGRVHSNAANADSKVVGILRMP